MIKHFIFLACLILFFNSCGIQENKKIKISITTWIGYTPLFYAKEKKWLEPLNIKLLNVVSLSENMYLYKAGNSDAYVGTQYEYNLLSNENKNLTPIMLFDKSNGGDVILSNISIEELLKTDKQIDAYLEIDSINSILLEDFLKIYNLKNKKINYINEDQAYISKLNSKNLENPTIIVTYTPYNYDLEKNGFNELSSTKNNSNLLVIDAMFTNEDFFNENKKEFLALKSLVDKAVLELANNPKEFYETIKLYLPNTSYEEFLASLNDIVWINSNVPEEIITKLRNSNFKTRDIIKWFLTYED